MDPEYDHNEAAPDPDWDREPEPLPTADALAALCQLIDEFGGNCDLGPSDRQETRGSFCYLPFEPDILINYQGSELILSLRPSNYLRSHE